MSRSSVHDPEFEIAFYESVLRRSPRDVQVVELHDCFAHNELLSYEALGLCGEGEGEGRQGQVREGSKEGALFLNNAFKETFTADNSGVFVIRASGPAGSQLSVSQKKPGSNSYAQNLAFPIEAGLAR